MACAIAVLLGACHSTNTAPPGTPVMTMSQPTDRTDYASYIISIDSISFTQNDGTIVTPLITAETVDFTRLNNFTELVEAPAVPSGTYTNAIITVDYSAAQIALSKQGLSIPCVPVDYLDTDFTTLAVTVTFDPRNPLVVTEGESVRLNVDFNLEASNSVSVDGDPCTLLVQPFIIASPAPLDNSVMRARGVFVTTQTIPSGFFMNTRPFFDLFSQLGALIVNTDASTYWNINGSTFVGAAGLKALPSNQANLPVVAYGTLSSLSGITPSFNATSVYVGTSQESQEFDSVLGTVSARTDNTLTLTGATLFDVGGTVEYFSTATVTVDDTTIVSIDGVPASNLSISALSPGQEISVSGIATISTTLQLSLDATGADTVGAQARLAQTTLWATLASATPGSATVGMFSLDNWDPVAFNFAGTGTSAANDASYLNYRVNTGTQDLSSNPVDALFQFTGIVASFGSAPPDYLATTITPADSTPQTLVVEWATDTELGDNYPFSSISADGLVIDLSKSDLSLTHNIRTGPRKVDLDSLPASPLITWVGADQSNLQLAIGSATVPATGISVFNNTDEFIAAVRNTFTGSARLYRLVAYGQYDSASNRFIATRIYLALQETTATTS
jgi:hypothetical protein